MKRIKHRIASLVPNLRKGAVWVVIAVVVTAVSLTAQAPKSPAPSQSASEVGRYVFWSVDPKDSKPQYGFLDTKRGRVWRFASPTDPYRTWYYHDLNEEAISVYRMDAIEVYHQYMKDSNQDTTKGELWKKYGKKIDSLVADFEVELREKEK